MDFSKELIDFVWGVSSSAYQTEGAHDLDGKGPSIWDEFTNSKPKKIKNRENGNSACDFYNLYEHDLDIMQNMQIPNFRFSLSWARIKPNGVGHINHKGVDYYNRLIDNCLEKGITPWVTLYHWDLPQALEKKGGWTNRDVIYWFEEYAELCARTYGDRVKNWMVLNEPMVFVGAGYFLGVHAPGRMGMGNFLPAIHHATMAMGVGGRLLKSIDPTFNVGTTFSCSHIEPFSVREKDQQAAVRVDALLNRLFIEPTLGLGYPIADLRPLKKIENYFKAGDEQKLKFDFDYIGIQNYTREIVKYSFWTPYLKAKLVKPQERNADFTLMNWEVYPDSIYHIIKKYDNYAGIKNIYITENGAAFDDHVHDEDFVHDHQRKQYLQEHIHAVLKAKKEGAKVKGYFVWTWTDNFEWAEGFHPRFGLVYVDFKSQKRIIKNSGKWYSSFINSHKQQEITHKVIVK